TTFRSEPGRARDEAEDPVIPGRLRGEAPGTLEAVGHQRVAQSDLDDLVEVGQDRLQFADEIQVCRKVAHVPARDEGAPKQPVAGESLVQSQQPLADAEAVRVGGRKASIVGDHAEVRHVDVEAFHIDQHDALINVTGSKLVYVTCVYGQDM